MRTMDFTMVRSGLVMEGQKVKVIEGKVAANYYYTIDPAVAMSANYSKAERLSSTEGIVKEIKETPRGFFVVVEFDE